VSLSAVNLPAATRAERLALKSSVAVVGERGPATSPLLELLPLVFLKGAMVGGQLLLLVARDNNVEN
jgi:hypothetical protein